jgi:hypothetical protein
MEDNTMKEKYQMLIWQQSKESGILAICKNLSLDVRFFLLDASFPITIRPAISMSERVGR